MEAAYEIEAVGDAFRVARWVGPSGRDVTEWGLPLPSALPDIGDALGAAIPESAQDVTDVPRVHRAWAAALGMVLLADDEEGRVVTRHVDPTDIPEDERLDFWANAMLAAIEARLNLPGLDDAPELGAIALEALSELEHTATEEQAHGAIERRIFDEFAGFESKEDTSERAAELARLSSPLLLAELTAFGAVDEDRAVTALGQWLRQELPGWGQPPDMFQEMLAGLDDKLAAAGVDPNDNDQMREWLEQNPGELFAVLGEIGSDGDDDVDFATMDLKEAFELPDSLPPVSLPAAADLARDARASDAADSDADDDTALEAWCEKLYELLSGDEYLRPDGLDDEAVAAVDEFELDFAGTGAILAVILFLNGSGIDLAELRETVKETAGADLDEADVEQEWDAWLRAYGDPADNLLDRLGQLGATGHDDAGVWLLPLGRYGVRERLVECGVSVPLLPPPEEMSVTELIAAAEGGDEDELVELSRAWLAAQDPRAATTQLLDAAADGSPAQRVFATAIANEIEPAHQDCWEAVLDRDSLRPYAKIALARIHGELPGEGNELEPSWADLGWMLADTVASLASALEENELAEELALMEMPAEGQPEVFDGVRRSGHPHAHEVLTAIGTHHPDTTAAKAARKAAFKAGSNGQKG